MYYISLCRYTIKVQREVELDEKALSNLQSDRQRFLCKAVENYIQCLEQGEEHDTWVFRLASLWLENADVKAVNDMMKVRKNTRNKIFVNVSTLFMDPAVVMLYFRKG